jgi:hypothetical protein
MGRVNRASRDRGQQLPLPLDVPGDGRRRALRRAGLVTAFLLRWALRLGLPLLGAAIALQALPYQATVQGVPFTVRATLFHQTGLSADTTVGSWIFPKVDGLPLGVHVSPRDVDVLAVTRAASGDTADYVRRLQADFTAAVPHIVLYLVGVLLLGVLAGLLAAAAVNMSIRYVRGLPRRPRELRSRALQLGAAGLVLVGVAGVGWFSYNPRWAQQSRLTGTLAAAQLFPDQLQQYYATQTKALDVLGSVVGIQAALQEQINRSDRPATALRIMFISDMHLAANYGLVAQYAASYGVGLIINTGDESEFGTAQELTPAYLDQVRALTAHIPMLWVAGNHDSPAVAGIMASIPGVTVLGAKAATSEGYRVTAGIVHAFGLTIAGLPDPRLYGGSGDSGSDDTKITTPLQQRAVDAAVGTEDPAAAGTSSATASATASSSSAPSGAADGRDGVPDVDIFMLHGPVGAREVRTVLGDRVRETAAGHQHQQNDPGDLQHGSGIDLIEGSTGAGGLDNITRGADRPPIEFSIESVGANCEFTDILRFQIQSAPAGTDAGTPQAYGDDVSVARVSFRPQGVPAGRTCGRQLGVGSPRDW